MKKSIIVLCCVFLLTGSAIAADSASGVVFLDENGNGKMDRGERGIPSVSVSNGIDVVQTDSEGRYSLKINYDTIIFVIKPAGYTFPVNEINRHKFYYIHKPKGSPEYEYPGVTPTGNLPKSVDFALLKTDESDNFKAVLCGDTQARNAKEVEYFRKDIVSELKGNSEYSFAMILGDNVYDDLDVFEDLNNATSETAFPWYAVMGNHDRNLEAETDESNDETWEMLYGPSTYSFNYGKVHFIVIDDILSPDPRDGNGYWGGIRTDQLKFIENDLKFVPKDNLIVLTMHIPLWNIGNYFRGYDRERLFRILKDYPNTLSVSAHTHYQVNALIGREDGWLQKEPHHHLNVGTTCGDWWSGTPNQIGVPETTMRDGTPNGYAVITFTGNKYVIDYKCAGKPQDYRMHIIAPKVVAKGVRQRGPLLVNFYMGSDKSIVEYRAGNGNWRRMRKISAPDPLYTAAVHEWDMSETLPEGIRPSNPVMCEHLWMGSVPVDLAVGNHTIEIRIKDMYGRTFTGSKTYRIEDAR